MAGSFIEHKLVDLVEILDSFRRPVSSTEREGRKGGIPYYGATGQAGWIDGEIFNEELVLLGEDAIDFSNPSAKKAYLIKGPSWVNNHVHVLRVKPEKVDSYYLVEALNRVDYSDYATFGTRSKLTQASMRGIKVSLPSLEKQRRIVDLLSSVDSYIEVLQNQLEKIVKARKAVSHHIFHTQQTDWRFTQLDKCTQRISDGSHNPPKGVDASEYLMLSSKDIWDGYITNLNPRYLEEKDFGPETKRTQLEVGDVLLTIVGTIGRCAVYRGYPQNVTFQRSVCVIKPNKEILNADFLMMYLQSIQVQLDQDARGVAQRGIYLNQIRSLDVPTPPMEEQLKVVSTLGALDEVIRVSKVLLQDTQGLRSALLSDLISGEHPIPPKYDEVMREI